MPNVYDATLNGMIGDGVTDNRVAFNNFFDNHAAQRPLILFFPPGRYLFSDSGNGCGGVLKYSDVGLLGVGKDSQIVGTGRHVSGHGVGPLFTSTPTDGTTLARVTLEGLYLTSDNTDVYPGIPYSISLLFFGTRAVDCSVKRCFFNTVNLSGIATNAGVDRLEVHDSVFEQVGEHGIYLAGGTNDSSRVTNNHFLGVAASALGVLQTAIAGKRSTSMLIRGNEVTGTWRNSAITPSDFPNDDMIIEGNNFHNMTTPGVAGINCNFSTRLRIRFNTFREIAHTGLLVNGSSPVIDLLVEENDFEFIRGPGRAVTIQNAGTAPQGVRVRRNHVLECLQGIEVDGALGRVEVDDNVVEKGRILVADNNPAFYFLNVGPDWHARRNRAVGYKGSVIPAAVEQQDNDIRVS